jgi:hypothetical protein
MRRHLSTTQRVTLAKKLPAVSGTAPYRTNARDRQLPWLGVRYVTTTVLLAQRSHFKRSRISRQEIRLAVEENFVVGQMVIIPNHAPATNSKFIVQIQILTELFRATIRSGRYQRHRVWTVVPLSRGVRLEWQFFEPFAQR